MIVVVAANVAPDEATKLIEKYFASMKTGRRREPVVPQEPRQLGQRRRFLEWDVKISRLRIGYHIPDLSHPDLYGLDVAAIILGQGQSSRLSRRIKHDEGLVHSISASVSADPPDSAAHEAAFRPPKLARVFAVPSSPGSPS